jgi:hypothetical protein
MSVSASIFWDFNLPNSTTWFYFSFLLAMALFFRFSRVLSMRNWDVVTLFLLVPGLLLLQDSRQPNPRPEKNKAVRVAAIVGAAAGTGPLASSGVAGVAVWTAPEPGMTSQQLQWLGYLVLLVGSAYFLFRCLLDLLLVQRPALAPNLNFGGLAWLAGALFICLVAVAYRPEERPRSVAPGPTQITVSPGVQSVPSVGQESAPLALVPFEFWVKRTFAVLCHLAVVVALVMIGYLHFQDASAGMAAATFYLMLPYTGIYVGQAHHVWPIVLLTWALVLYRFPLFAGLLLGLAAATAYFPALVFPLWLSFYWRRGAGRFLAGFLLTAGACLAVTAFLLWQTDELAGRVRDALSWPAWQPWRDIPANIEGFWTGSAWAAYRIPVFIAYLAFVILTACWPYPKNLAHVIALSAAVLIGIQFWYADQGGVYVLWYLPLLLVLVFRPNLSERRPLQINAETDWLTRAGRALRRWLGGWLQPQERMVRAAK